MEVFQVEPPQPAIEVFQDQAVEFVRLRSLEHGTYVHVAEDGCSVLLDARRESHNAVWAVQRQGPGTPYVLLRGSYGRYLGAPDEPLCILCERQAATQCDFYKPEIQGIMWRAIATSECAVVLHDASGRFLRAYSRRLPWHTGVCVSTFNSPWTVNQWAVEVVPRSLGRPELPFVSDSKWAKFLAWVCKPLFRRYQRWPLERGIWWVVADDSGNFSQEEWRRYKATSRNIYMVEKNLDNRLGLPMTVCIIAGRHGQPSPLSINRLTAGSHCTSCFSGPGQQGDAQLIYPELNVEIAGREMRRLNVGEGQCSSEDTRPINLQEDVEAFVSRLTEDR